MVDGDIPQSSSESLVIIRRCRGQDELTGSIYNSSTNPNPDFALYCASASISREETDRECLLLYGAGL